MPKPTEGRTDGPTHQQTDKTTDVVEGYLTALGKELEDIHIELLTGYFKLLESTPVALR